MCKGHRCAPRKRQLIRPLSCASHLVSELPGRVLGGLRDLDGPACGAVEVGRVHTLGDAGPEGWGGGRAGSGCKPSAKARSAGQSLCRRGVKTAGAQRPAAHQVKGCDAELLVMLLMTLTVSARSSRVSMVHAEEAAPAQSVMATQKVALPNQVAAGSNV